MREFRTRTHIAAPSDRVWQILADFPRWPRWTASITRIEPLDNHPPGPGTRVRIVQPRLRPAVWTVTLWDPGRSFVWGTHSLGINVVATHTIIPATCGCTVALRLEFLGRLGTLAGWLGGRLTEHYLALESQGLKAAAESDAR